MGILDNASRSRAGAKAGAGVNGKSGESHGKPWELDPKARHEVPVGITAADLMRVDFPPLRWLLPELLTSGVTILGGKPKHGKSWLALLIAWAIAADCELDGRGPWGGDVLYLALEDTQRRLQNRLKKLHTVLGWDVPATLHLHTAWPRAADNGLYHIADWLDARKSSARLVIVDTLAKFRNHQKPNSNAYDVDYETAGELKQLIDHYGVASLVLHHTRKQPAEDPFDEISGTLGLTGAADSLWVLDTQRKGAEARLYATGRDLADSTTALTFAGDSGRWSLGPSKEGIDTEGRGMQGQQKLTAKVGECAGWLRDFLKQHAFPSKEIEAAAKAAGYSFSALRDAKASMGQGENGTKELCNHNYGGDKNNDWWSGLGPWGFWKLRPPPKSAARGHSGESDRIPE